MATSDLLGIFHYYAHCIAASYRDSSVRESPGVPPDNETSQEPVGFNRS
ncbi:MAG: hypothetical protein RQ847_02695 [Wenzhouxiangellaceae bacterium]|nr:hypothetical protein [Wenzhouxiangellaceae bacterium]